MPKTLRRAFWWMYNLGNPSFQLSAGGFGTMVSSTAGLDA